MSYRARYLFFSQFKPNTPTTIGKEFNIIHKLDNLYNRVAYSEEKNFEVGKSIFGLKSKTVMPSMMEPQIELELLNILEESKKAEIDIIFIFDELDKISLSVTEPNSSASNKAAIDNLENETVDGYVIRRKKRVDSLLGSLKTLITTGKARFFFIAGRDILDSYQAEKGSTSSLYESLFNQVFEVPSFLTDNSDQDKSRLHSMIEYYVCSRLMDEENAERL